MKAVIVVPETSQPWCLSNLIDRPCLRHIADFLAAGGIQEIWVVGLETKQAQTLLCDGWHWDAKLHFGNSVNQPRGECILLASAACLPKLSLRDEIKESDATTIYNSLAGGWTGWAFISKEDSGAVPPFGNPLSILRYLEGLPHHFKRSLDLTFRCTDAEEVWKAHRDAQASNLSMIFHDGLETKPGVWIGRNVNVSATAEITAPVYIGENSRVGPGTKIGPFAVVARDCLIAPQTIVRNSVIAPGTYTGDHLELDHVLVNRGQLFDLRFGVSVERVDSPILDGVFDFHFDEIPKAARHVFASAVSLVKQVIPG